MKAKHILQTLIMLFIAFTTIAQQGINYKAVINDGNGDVLANTLVTLQFTILENGTISVYKESHSPTTDVNGIVIVNIGEGNVVSGDFNSINWGSNLHFLKTEIDTGDGLTDMGTTEFKTVPYAMYAKTAEETLSVDGSETKVTGSSGITVTGLGTTTSPYVISNATGATTYSIGLDNTVGGYIFYVTPDGKHGLVASAQDANGIFVNNWYTAPDICNWRVFHNSVENNFMDWRLPEVWELGILYEQRENIGGFNGSTYWSSTEWDDTHAWYRNFDDGVVHSDGLKTGFRSIRAIRDF